MDNDILIPWYKLVADPQRQRIYNGTASAAHTYKPQPKPQPSAPQKSIGRAADLVLMELTVKVRKEARGEAAFEWPTVDSFHELCTSWHDEQKAKGLNDIVYLCGEETMKATGKFFACCLICWYADGHMEGFVPSQEHVNGIKPVLKTVGMKPEYVKPVFAGNATDFKEALRAIADYAPFEGWKKKFEGALALMDDEMLRYSGQEDTFAIEPPYFRYLCAVRFASLGAGMGSWGDLPMAGTESFRAVTHRFSVARDNALMYAINNC
jgi:hypothetical protein